ncbi:LysR family transcriptional regulator [Cloacibacillus evryensis]|uniref:LysR family transcriptional regulator n=3 Tax=Cloacibacillus evryensis TaxID=508460 RepID=A0AAW5K385_9BACT|nr:LysR family transcriptional regulator [Cloacibacillus evryensis]EHL69817.1 hypothetical protein HMPREF1006_01773 [Synergistes sp. 3_1_syn1]MCQ4765318.1 LysR family transcriptional regulator [Cloacibacillus evryensis]MCQ4815265.1 LysR family transcriptional regulator [Cloacibacillus evryensis]
MNIREEEYVLAIWKYRNIKSAADELLISPPGLSMFLSGLEKRLGVKLFHRVGKHLSATDIGMEYISHAQKITEQKREFDAQLSDYKNEVTGTISVGLHPRRTTYMIPRAVKTLTNRYPKVKTKIFEGTSQELFEKVRSGDLDFSIINRECGDAALEAHELYRDRLVAVLSPDHPLAKTAVSLPGEKLPWLDLTLFANERFILQHPEQSSRMYAEAALKYAGITPVNIFIIENLETASQMAAESLGIAFNMYSFTKNFAYDKPVRYFIVGDRNRYIRYNVVKRKGRSFPIFTRFFIEALKNSVTAD